MTREDLRDNTRKELAVLAGRYAIAGRHRMTKDQLISAIARAFARRSAASDRRAAAAKSTDKKPANGGGDVRSAKIIPRIRAMQAGGNSAGRDFLNVEVCDPFWVRLQWGISLAMLQRAEVALGTHWHRAVPVLRIYDVTTDDAEGQTLQFLRDVPVNGEVDHWYVQVDEPPRGFKFHLGYRAQNGTFFVLARSRRVATPQPRSLDAISFGDAETAARGRNGFVTQLPRTNGYHVGGGDDFAFHVDAELVIHGATNPGSELAVLGEDVPLNSDGTFSLRVKLPDGRQIIPAVVVTPDGAEQRTIVLGIERNTKELEPQPIDDELF